MTHQVEFVRTPATTVAVVHFRIGSEDLSEIGTQLEDALDTVAAELGKAPVATDGPAVARYEPTDGGFDVAAGFQVPPAAATPAGLERLELEQVEAAHVTHIGPYDELPAAYADLHALTAAAGRTVASDAPMWEEYWSEPGTPEDQLRTEIFWPLAPRPVVSSPIEPS